MRKILTLSALMLLTGQLLAQDYYYFKKWKAKGEIEASSITLVMDTTNSTEGRNFNQRLAEEIVEQLTKLNITANFIFTGEQVSDNALIIQFDQLKPAYVQLNTFEKNGIPLCNRFEIIQLTELPSKTNRTIQTTLSISVDKELEGIQQASTAFAELLNESISIE
ncbi:MAG: hypothetical protein RIC80_13425 [Cyclobacteriaceae bacterium]